MKKKQKKVDEKTETKTDTHHDSKKVSANTRRVVAVGLLALVGVAGAAYLAYQNNTLQKELLVAHQNMTAFQDLSFQTQTNLETTITQLEEEVTRLGGDLEEEREENEELNDDLKKEKQKNDDFEDQIGKISETVGVLDKLSKTDKELLQKYSKVYFLNEHYVPESLKEIDDEWKYVEEKSNQLHTKVMPFFEDMLDSAKDDGIKLWVVSAYRSFDTQAQLKGQYSVTYGNGANTFSADQGFSEHQLGTTIDFTTANLGGGLEGFGATPAYEWLLDNAHKYGFTLSYPPNNAFYVFEPWHWRYVGKDLARDLKRDDAFFYDWEQREIDKYLISIFD